jgi:hypothetical protein
MMDGYRIHLFNLGDMFPSQELDCEGGRDEALAEFEELTETLPQGRLAVLYGAGLTRVAEYAA